MSDWITDRLPTEEDQDPHGYVWGCNNEGMVYRTYVENLNGDPWQPIIKPAPYVKPKRWTVEWCYAFHNWMIVDSATGKCYYSYFLKKYQKDVAQRIADIYNEVMP